MKIVSKKTSYSIQAQASLDVYCTKVEIMHDVSLLRGLRIHDQNFIYSDFSPLFKTSHLTICPFLFFYTHTHTHTHTHMHTQWHWNNTERSETFIQLSWNVSGGVIRGLLHTSEILLQCTATLVANRINIYRMCNCWLKPESAAPALTFAQTYY